MKRRRRRARQRRRAILALFALTGTASFLWGFALGSDDWPEPDWRQLADEGAFG
jgi:cell division septal protein FtsQ